MNSAPTAQRAGQPPLGTRARGNGRPHMIYLAIGFPPAAKSCAYRMRETANQFCAAGWDVTVVTIAEESWEREYGLDYTLSERVDPRVKIVELPLARDDLETNIRAYSEARTLRPSAWIANLRKRSQKSFPEPIFGDWRAVLEQGLLKVHRDNPADLLVTTCAPYINLAATWRLWQEARVPYVIDFRDGWSIDVINGGEAFTKDSVQGRWEARVLEHAISIWCVNDPIAEFYRDRYPELAHRVRVVRNGYDPESLPTHVRRPGPTDPLAFGYLGALNLPLSLLEAVLDGWRIARREDPVIAKSQFEVRGHIGAGWSRGDNIYMELLKAAAPDGVIAGGAVPKAEVAATYGRWDALVLMVIGGRYMTSGKVYELAASGLPVISAHEPVHDASTVLSQYPLWTGATGIAPEAIAGAFRQAAALASGTSDADRAAAKAKVEQFSRSAQLAPAVRQVTELVLPADDGRATRDAVLPARSDTSAAER
jgi:glycosyltransferase involved in cell wall biosynthesis